MKNKKLFYLTQAAVIAGLYAALTLAQGVIFPFLTFGPIQFRVSEVLCILALYTPAAIPGLTVGCVIGNLVSNLGAIDLLLGPLASFLAALSVYGLRRIRWFGLPILSALMPALFNGVLIGFEIALMEAISRLTAGTDGEFYLNGIEFLIFGGEVAVGELGVLLVLGLPLSVLLDKHGKKIGLIPDQPK